MVGTGNNCNGIPKACHRKISNDSPKEIYCFQPKGSAKRLAPILALSGAVVPDVTYTFQVNKLN